MKDWFKCIRKKLKTTAWSVCVTIDNISRVRICQMINQKTDLDYHSILKVTSLNTPGLEQAPWGSSPLLVYP